MKIQKRVISDDLYRLLENGNIDKIIRHYKIISERGYIKNGYNELSQKVDDNTVYGTYNKIYNRWLDELLNFDGFHKFTNEISQIIENSTDTAYSNYAVDINGSDFTEEELTEIDNLINAYNSEEVNRLYIRLGINPNNKAEFLQKLYELFIAGYFNELNENYQDKLLAEKLTPMWNDTIFYSESKYNYIKDKNIEGIEND